MKKNTKQICLYEHRMFNFTEFIPCKVLNRNADGKTLIIEFKDPVDKILRKKWVLKHLVIWKERP